MNVRRREGQSLIEFAMVLPLLLILVFGIIEFSVLMYDKAVITNASREGARVGIVSQDRKNLAPINKQITDTVTTYCATHLITFGDPVDALKISPPKFSGTTFGKNLTVTVNYTYGFLVLPKFITGIVGPLGLQATTVMNLE